jgi:hypothetical protein
LAKAVVGPDFTTTKSATGITVVVTLLVLLVGDWSGIPLGGVTVATLVIEAPVPAVPVTVNVMLPPLGRVGMANVPPCKAVTLGLAGQTAPPVALPQVTDAAVKFATLGSLTVALFNVIVLLLVTTIVYVTVPLAFTLAGPVFTTTKSIVGLTGVVTLLVLLVGVGSVTPLGGVTVATLVIEAPVPAVPVTVKVMLPPLGKVGMANVPACRAVTVGLAGQVAPPVTLPHVTEAAVKLATLGSLTVALSAAFGPLFVTTIV